MSRRLVPVELLMLIVHQVQRTRNLKNVRLASKLLSNLAAPLLFRTVVVKEKIYSAEWLVGLQEGTSEARDAVKEVDFEGASYQEIAAATDAQNEETRTALNAAYAGLHRFKNLQRLDFCFEAFDIEHIPEFETLCDAPSHFRLLQLGLFGGLAAHPLPRLSSLEIFRLLPLHDKLLTDETFLAIFTSLRRLDISVSAQGEPVPLEDEEFFQSTLPLILQHATALDSLSLHRTYPRAVNFSSIHFPKLTFLQLDNFILEPTRPDYDALNFIVRHKATLKTLELTDCCVYGGEQEIHEDGVYPRPWGDVLKTVEKQLVHLRSFRIESIENPPFAFEYVVLDSDRCYIVTDEARIGMADKDEAALKSLMSALQSRSLTEDIL
ncbi:hypothetical protein R3P38DRAFT_2910336 [Favolaschia claudopus]|uniref:F-box domain-containing protein n=1 Tax=Favolaschia claudopus TaxID=2862362 RepID=A0AAW0C9H5_9AGAR